MSRAEKIFVTSMALSYLLGTLLWGRYPFYPYLLFVGSPRSASLYLFSDQAGKRIEPQTLSFDGLYRDGNAFALESAGRDVRTIYQPGLEIPDEELKRSIETYLSAHPETNTVRVDKLIFSTRENKRFALQTKNHWEFHRP